MHHHATHTETHAFLTRLPALLKQYTTAMMDCNFRSCPSRSLMLSPTRYLLQRTTFLHTLTYDNALPHIIMASEKHFDYIIVGGGQAGCVLAARLRQAHPSLLVALIEAGPDESHHHYVQSPALYPMLHSTPLQYSYQSTPQPQLEGRQIPNWGGRLRQLFQKHASDSLTAPSKS